MAQATLCYMETLLPPIVFVGIFIISLGWASLCAHTVLWIKDAPKRTAELYGQPWQWFAVPGCCLVEL